MRKNWLYLLGCAVLMFSSCRKETDLNSKGTSNQVYFSSKIAGLPQTRAQGTQWSANDAIGIFMFQNGVPLSGTSVVNNGFNKPYSTNGNGNFSPLDAQSSLEFPTGSKVSFVAYYPYQSNSTLTPTLNIANQENQPLLDFMIARNTTGLSAGQGPVALTFERQMTKVELKLKGTDLSGLKANFTALSSTAVVDLSSGQLTPDNTPKDIPAKVYLNASNETIVEWTIFPGVLTAQNKIVFTKTDGKTFTWTIGAGTTFTKGHRYQYDITLGQDGGVTPQPTASYMELPVIAEHTNIKYNLKMSTATRRNYSMLYDTQYKVAYWVAYPLSNDYLGSQDRTDKWAYDPAFLSNLQANLESGYPNNASLQIDRGHQLPSGDRTYNRAENESTFYYTNMTPQNRSLNQGVWANLENKIRTWTTQAGVDTMYVVTGAMVTTATDKVVEYVQDNSGKQVAKPKYYYKVLAMKQGSNYYTIGFRMNNVSPSNTDYMNYTVTVESLEKETGFTFFPALSKEAKSTINTQIWRK
ncbi:DNA/RNA non-specific endonuclease [Sphingobacterium spiritivorum]|uniref:DNA/RNA non-specific endonuclease n=1 Tax=Sphingobacterium spiritivorum TaxID=258 RepID=UPI003DA28737